VDKLTIAFSKNFKKLRQKKKLSQGEVAMMLGISVSYVSMLERGQRSPPLKTIADIARAFRITPAALLS
jgi:transcriptional regulator with XRE-family HTH domain